ncbi:MAG: tetratricopeptide repeat protein [Nitrospirota bacterium]
MAVDKNTIIKEAQKHVAKGQFDKAIAEWKKLLKETPNDANIYNTIGDLCLKKDSKSEAVEAYHKAANLLAADGFTSKAIALFKKVLNIDPKKMDAHLALGDLNAEKGLTGNALESYKLVADHYTQQNQTAKALDIYQKMADLNPSNVVFQIRLGDMYAKEGMREKSAKAYLAAADAYLSRDAFKDARHLFEKILALDPGNKEVYHKAGIVYFKEGKFVEACKALKPAFESDPSNKELFELYLEALDKAGKDVEAEQVLRKLLAENPDNAELREKLYNLYLAKKDFEKALVEAGTLVDGKIESGNTEEAEEIYKTFVAGSPYFPPIRQKLAEFYISVNRPLDAATELMQAAELFVTEGDLQSAGAVLAQAIEIAPDIPGAKERLEQLQPSVTSAPPPEPEPTTAEEPVPITPSPVVSEPEPLPALEAPSMVPAPPPGPPIAEEPVSAKEDPAVIAAFTEADVLIKYGLADKAVEQLEALSSNFPENPRIRIKLRELYREQGNIEKAVQHALFAVSLYSKFGREDQAAATLQETLEMAPGHPAVRSRLGMAPVEPEEPAREAFSEVPQPEIVHDDLDTPLFSSDVAPPSLEETLIETTTPDAPVHSDEIEFEGFGSELPPLEELSPAETFPVAEPTAIDRQPVEEEPPLFETPFDAEPAAIDQQLVEEEPPIAETPFDTEPALIDRQPVEEEPMPIAETPFDAEPAPIDQQPAEEEPPLVETSFVTDPTEEEPPLIEKEFAGESEQPVLAETEAAVHKPPEVDIDEIWAEAEFYFQQGLFDEAKKHYTQIVALTPGNQRAGDRLAEISREENETREFAQLTDAVEGLEGHFPPASVEGVLATSASDDEAVRALMLEIQQLKQQSAPPPPPLKDAAQPQATAANALSSPVEPAEKADEEDFFDLGAELQREAAAAQQGEAASGEFFDLATELKDELSNITTPVRPVVPAEEQSLDDIFEEFKKGVEQQSAKEDADTHYNLGVAYKEMGLLDDAIGEFIMTPEDEPKFVQSRYLLGLCYMEKGEYQNAIGEIRSALDYADSLGFETENRIEMHYDLGLACQCAGDIASATDEFQKVVDEDPGYRDTTAKLQDIQKGDFISLEQLKDDIEKEISTKFLEEGVRIEREEKTRKNERVGK